MRITGAVVPIMLLAVVGCGSSRGAAPSPPAPVPPPGYAILPGSAMGQMLNQCSRGAPKPGQATWQPTPGDVARMEVAVGQSLKRQSASRPELAAGWPAHWSRAYVGIVRDGRRYIYGDFAAAGRRPQPPTGPAGVCDGGPSFFGAEWEPATGAITQIDFNGVA